MKKIYYILLYMLFYTVSTLFIALRVKDLDFDPIFFVMSLILPIFLLSIGRYLSVILSFFIFLIIEFNIYIVLMYHKTSFEICVAIAGSPIDDVFTMIEAVPLQVFLSVIILQSLLMFITWKAAFNRPKVAAVSLACFGTMLGGRILLKSDIGVEDLYKNALVYDHFKKQFVINGDAELYGYLYGLTPGYLGITLTELTLALSYNTGHFKSVPISLKGHDVTDPVITSKNTPKVRHIVMIVGESDSALHHNLYGYRDYETTPHLKNLYNQGQVCFIPKVHSGANLTRDAVPMLLSFYDADHPNKLLKEKNLIELAKDNGYITYWMGAQEGTNVYGSSYGFLGHFADHYLMPHDTNMAYSLKKQRDQMLLPMVKKEFSSLDKSKPYFIIIHLMGSHTDYIARVRKEDVKALPTAGSYNQAIHHTDHSINEIIELSKKYLGDFTLLYSPDHGELLRSPDLGEHGIYDGGYDQYKIGIYLAGDNHTNYCQQAETLRSDNGYFASPQNKYLLLTMMGYGVSQKGLDYIKSHDRVVNSGIAFDYDKIPQPKRKKQ
ncbi:sulfatase-like hydrolase/transferase [Aristophania vespae]|uniref:Sulfatase-like hydrolase/transferase n=1 Tax=Aristophania vespae TaxID=2697033 RepID=A0A6P1NCN1_9PROT|nr:sulfatase-like hydrolase/transferase [Aristophania vespae]QHI96076.1 sulfatase-like hydrolase/transferase [Aristophania vespae]